MDTNPYIYGMHDLCPENILDGRGTIVHAARLGHNPDDYSSVDFLDRPETMIVRLQHGWHPDGTLPEEYLFDSYLARVENFVSTSKGVRIWITWNEPNHSQERPHGHIITPTYAGTAHVRMRDKIRSLPGHEDDLVLLGAVAPWNLESGDWLQYFRDVFWTVGTNLDGITLHAYTHGTHPDLIFSNERRHGWLWHFRTYQQQIDECVPHQLLHLPFWITETNQTEPWNDYNTGWVQNAYREIDDWNRANNPEIRALVLYRWAFDQWELWDKPGVVADLHAAMEHHYTWIGTDPPEETMLLNPSFEGDWYNQTPDGILVLPEHWRAEYQEGDDPYKRPEIKPNQEFVTDGQWSIRAFPPEHSRGFYGIWQEVDVTPGQWYRFSADVRVESEPPGKLGAFVGIQPWGASIFARQMIWGEEIVNSHDWTTIEVFAQAFGGVIRVAMGADNEYRSRNNTTWWDNAKLESWECDGGTDPPIDPPGECGALTYSETVNAVEEGVSSILGMMCSTLGIDRG